MLKERRDLRANLTEKRASPDSGTLAGAPDIATDLQIIQGHWGGYCFVGVCAALGLSFVFVQSRIIPLENVDPPIFALVYYVGLSIVSGYVAQPLLDKIGDSLLKRVNKAELHAAEARSQAKKAKAEAEKLGRAIERTKGELEDARDRAIATSERAIAMATVIPKALDMIRADHGRGAYLETARELEDLLKEDGSVSSYTITLAALYKRAGRLDHAFDTIDSYIKKLEQNAIEDGMEDNYFVARYNRACYRVQLNADTLSEHPEIIEAAREDIEAAVENVDFVKNFHARDKDLTPYFEAARAIQSIPSTTPPANSG